MTGYACPLTGGGVIIRSSLMAGLYVSSKAALLFKPTIAGTGGCACELSVCDQSGTTITNIETIVSSFAIINSPSQRERCILWDNDRVSRLQSHVLPRTNSLDDIFVIERKLGLSSVRILAQHINRFLLCEIPKSARHRDRV